MATVIYTTRNMGDGQMNDDRYITERIVDKNGKLLMARVTMKEYKEWVDENGEPQVFHKTDTAGFKSPLAKKEMDNE